MDADQLDWSLRLEVAVHRGAQVEFLGFHTRAKAYVCRIGRSACFGATLGEAVSKALDAWDAEQRRAN